MRSWRARLVVLVTAATLLMPASALAQVLYLCTMSGLIGPKCCCSAPQEEPEAAPQGPRFERPDCCEAQAQASRDAIAAAADHMPSVGPAMLVSTLTITDLIDLERAASISGAAQARGPPALGPPIYLENCSLLR
jgi:hypothetical protein